tara:strand:- start:6 stop:503 length:498 start_codon:yes stop_codon:yes gene_type:complete
MMFATACFPGVSLLTFSAGLFFGFYSATLICSFASTIGATFTFLIARHMLGAALTNRLGQTLESINSELASNGKFYVLFVRLVPVFPFQIINLTLGLSKVSLRDFYLYSQIGMLPATAVLTYAGAKAVEIETIADIFTPQILYALFLIACVPLLGRLLRVRRKKL